MNRTLITGATGAIGPQVVAELCNLDYRIRTFSIDPLPVGNWPNDLETRIGDVTDPSAVLSAMESVDSVIHMASLLHIVNPPPAMHEKYEQVNVGGTANVVAAAIKAGVKRVVLFSTIAVYGPSNGQILTEESSPNPDTFYAHTKLAAEKIVLEARNTYGEPLGIVLRLGAIYGSRIKGNYERLLQSLAKRRFIPIGDGSNRRTLVYDKDVAHAVVLTLKHPAAAGKILNVSDGEFHTLNDIILTICQALGRKPPCFSLPVAPIRFAAGIVEDIGRWVGIKPPIVRATISKYTEDVAVDSRRIQQEIGFAPQYDLLTGWKDAIQEMRQFGTLQ